MLFVGALAFIFGWALTWKNHTVLQTVAQNPQLPQVEINGYTYHAQVFGDPLAPPLVVVHGGPGGDYRNLLPLQDLAPDLYVIFYDQRGSGLSARVEDASQITLDSAIDDLDAIIDHYATGRKVTLVGHSWGAMLATGYTSQNPDKVATLVLAEPGFLTPEIGDEILARVTPGLSVATLTAGLRSFFETLHVSGPDEDAQRDYFLQRMTLAPNASTVDGYWCGGKAPPAALVFWRMGAAARQATLDSALTEEGALDFDLLTGIEKYKGRVLLLASSCNTILGEAHQRRHEALLRAKGLTVDLQIVEGSGHLMFAERRNSITRVWRYLTEGMAEVAQDDKPAEISPGTPSLPPTL